MPGQMMQFKNGTDVAMLNGILNVIIGEKLYDQQYVQTYTEDFRKARESVKAVHAGGRCHDLRHRAGCAAHVARTFARAESAIIFWGMGGVAAQRHGTDNARCLIALSLDLRPGRRPGHRLHPLRGQNNVQGASDRGPDPDVLPPTTSRSRT